MYRGIIYNIMCICGCVYSCRWWVVWKNKWLHEYPKEGNICAWDRN